MRTEMTHEQAERIGRELVAEGFSVEAFPGVAILYGYRLNLESFVLAGECDSYGDFIEPCMLGKQSEVCEVSPQAIPDVRNPLTAKAVELWVESVAREACGKWAFDGITVNSCDDGAAVKLHSFHPGKWACVWHKHKTGPEACLAAVRSIRGEATAS